MINVMTCAYEWQCDVIVECTAIVVRGSEDEARSSEEECKRKSSVPGARVYTEDGGTQMK